MAADRRIRASDQDRESTAELLSEAYAVGRLSREEFDERVTAAYSAKTCGELRDLTADLPPPAERTGLPSGIVASRRVPRRTNRGLPRQMTWIYALSRAASGSPPGEDPMVGLFRARFLSGPVGGAPGRRNRLTDTVAHTSTP
jgi:hypothetical protein